MSETEFHRALIDEIEYSLLLIVIAFFGVGDVFTTLVAMQIPTPGVVEFNPVTRWAHSVAGPAGIILPKAAAILVTASVIPMCRRVEKADWIKEIAEEDSVFSFWHRHVLPYLPTMFVTIIAAYGIFMTVNNLILLISAHFF